MQHVTAWSKAVRNAMLRGGAEHHRQKALDRAGTNWNKNFLISTDVGLRIIRQTATAGAQSDLMNKERWGRRCMLQLQEAENWNKPAATTWAAEFLLREGESRECLGSWINSNAVHEANKRRAKQVITAHSHAGNGCTGSACVRAQDVNFAKKKGERTWRRLTPSQWKQWRTFRVPDVKHRRKVSLAPIIDAGGI